MTNEKSFTVSVEGDVTGEKWYGSFKAKTLLTHRDNLRIDQLRRDLLGGLSDGPAPGRTAIETSIAMAEMGVRITDAPEWWRASNNGLDLADNNVVQAVYNECMKAEKENLDELRKKAEGLKAELKKEAPEPSSGP